MGRMWSGGCGEDVKYVKYSSVGEWRVRARQYSEGLHIRTGDSWKNVIVVTSGLNPCCRMSRRRTQLLSLSAPTMSSLSSTAIASDLVSRWPPCNGCDGPVTVM